jgi:hypothetical protein
MINYLPLLIIIFGLFLIIYGSYNYLNPNLKVWNEKKAKIVKIDTINKKNTSKNIITYSYKVSSINYQGSFITNENHETLTNKPLIIYYNYKNPNVSFIIRPKEGVYRLALGLILLILGTLLYMSPKEEIESKITIDNNISETSKNNFFNSDIE